MFVTSPDAATVLAIDLGILLATLAMAQALTPDRALDRFLFGVVAASQIVVYAAWRLTDTLPAMSFSLASLWQHLYAGFEMVAVLYSLMGIVILLRRADHSPEADRAEAALEASGRWPAVDVFICSYNEPIDVIEKSILLSKAMDYPDCRIWVLDDTRRAWLRAYCEEVGVGYLTRPGNEGAKAGNLNNGLRATSGRGAAPLILVLDADFAPHTNLLKRTVGLFRDDRVGIVQTPQHYFNADPVQHNLMASKSWVDDQRIFFDVFQPAKDAWDAAFCVGTSFVVRRDRVMEIGGFPTRAVSEDVNLSYDLMRRGYVTRWLNEPLSVGLAAEGLPEYITQRARWCLGTIQVALLDTGPFRGSGLTLTQRLHYVHGLLNWLCKPFILLMLIAPAIYWIFDVPAFEADYVAFLRRAAPALITFYIYSGWISRQRTLPVFMEVTHMITAAAITWTLITCCYRPFGRPFKVTDKGGDRSRTIVRWSLLRLFGTVCLLSVGSIAWALLGPNAPTDMAGVDLLNLVWAGISALLSGVACLVCFERPRLHREELFETHHPARLMIGGRALPCTIHRLSTVDAVLRLAAGQRGLEAGTMVELAVDGSTALRGRVAQHVGDHLTLSLTLPEAQRRDLVVSLYSRPNRNVALEASMVGALRGLVQRSLGRD